jgi:shikimate kinase
MENRTEIGSRKIVLIGMMGSGKSSAGRRLARSLDSSFVDLDQSIERRAGRSIRDIFASDGEQTFRDLEEEELRLVLLEPGPLVVAAGGGVVVREANRKSLLAVDQVIWLQASLDILVKRVEARALRHEGHRPLVDGDPKTRLSALMAEREALYEEVATAVVVVDDQSLDEVVTALTALVSPEGDL